MRSMVGDIMHMRKSKPEEKRIDLLHTLLELKDKRDGILLYILTNTLIYSLMFVHTIIDITDNMITGYCLSMILEGFETSSGLMSFSLFEVNT